MDDFWLSRHVEKVNEWMNENCGKYKIISSKSSYPVEVNQYSSNIRMITEIQYVEFDNEAD